MIAPAPAKAEVGPFDLLVESPVKRERVKRAFADPEANHEERLWAATFLLGTVKVTPDELLDLIAQEARWSDYDEEISRRQVDSIARFVGGGSTSRAASVGPSRTASLPSSDPDYFPPPPSWAGARNREFMAGALGAAYQKGAEPHVIQKRTMFYQPNWAFFRTVGGVDHTLVVVDLDGTDLDATWEAARRLVVLWPPAILKFSGRKGFHAIYRAPEVLSREALKARGEELAREAGIEVGHGLACGVDPTLWTPKHLIRAYSVNVASGLYSIEVSPTEALEAILARATRPEWEQGAPR